MPGKNIGDLVVRVRSEGVDKTKKQLGDVKDNGIFSGGLTGGKKTKAPGGGEAAGGGAIKGIMDMIMGMSTKMLAMVAGIGAIVGILLTMEPIQKLLSAFMKIIQAFFTPLAMMLITLLSPVLRFLVKLLPLWFEFFRDPVGMIKKGLSELPALLSKLGQWIWDALGSVGEWLWSQLGKVGEWIADGLMSFGNWLWGHIKGGINFITKLPGRIGDWLMKLPGMIADAIGGFFEGIGEKINPLSWFQTGGTVPSTGVYGLHKGEAVFNQQQLRILENALRSNEGGSNIVISGGLDLFIERIQKNPNIGGF